MLLPQRFSGNSVAVSLKRNKFLWRGYDYFFVIARYISEWPLYTYGLLTEYLGQNYARNRRISQEL